MNKKLLIITNELVEKMKLHLPLYEKLAYIYGDITIVLVADIFTSKFNKVDKNTIIEYKSDKIDFFRPKSINELRCFLLQSKYIVINNFSEKWCDWYLWFLLKKMNIPLIRFFNRNILISFGSQQKSLQKVKPFFDKILGKLYLELVNIGIFAKVDTLFMSAKDKINIYKKAKNIDEIVLINNSLYDDFLEKNLKISDEYIIFLDSKVTYSLDQIKWGYKLIDRKLYFKKLNILFDKLEQITNKRVIICAHPTYDNNHKKEDYIDREVIKFKTDEYISKASFVMFHHTSAMYSAILMDKPVLLLECKEFNKYIKRQIKMYKDVFNFNSLDFFNIDKLNLNDSLTNIKINKKKYNTFKVDYLIANKDKFSIDIIVNKLDRKYNIKSIRIKSEK